MSHILVIDDEPSIREVVRRILEPSGHTIEEAEDGVEGMASLGRSRPDLVITDLLMPKRSGIDTIGRIRDSDPDLPILAISGGGRNGRLNFLSTARTFPRVWSLEKPFRPSALARLVAEILELDPPQVAADAGASP